MTSDRPKHNHLVMLVYLHRYRAPCSIAVALCLVFGCGDSETASPPTSPNAEARPFISIDKPQTGLSQYVRADQNQATRPTPADRPINLGIGLPGAKQAADPQLEVKRSTLSVRLLGSAQARGGTPEDWVGLEPGERFFRASAMLPTGRDENADKKLIQFRLKLDRPDRAKRWLGRQVQVKGYWITPPNVGRVARLDALPQPVELTRRRGQDLVDAVRAQQDRRLAQREAARSTQKTDAVRGEAPPAWSDKSISRGSAQFAQTAGIKPLFYAESVELLSNQSRAGKKSE